MQSGNTKGAHTLHSTPFSPIECVLLCCAVCMPKILSNISLVKHRAYDCVRVIFASTNLLVMGEGKKEKNNFFGVCFPCCKTVTVETAVLVARSRAEAEFSYSRIHAVWQPRDEKREKYLVHIHPKNARTHCQPVNERYSCENQLSETHTVHSTGGAEWEFGYIRRVAAAPQHQFAATARDSKCLDDLVTSQCVCVSLGSCTRQFKFYAISIAQKKFHLLTWFFAIFHFASLRWRFCRGTENLKPCGFYWNWNWILTTPRGTILIWDNEISS